MVGELWTLLKDGIGVRTSFAVLSIGGHRWYGQEWFLVFALQGLGAMF